MPIKPFYGPLKRGDHSPCGTKRFWQYGPSYRNGERWIPAEKFDKLREVELHTKKLSYLDPELRRELKANAKLSLGIDGRSGGFGNANDRDAKNS
jgi:hypothetical protein